MWFASLFSNEALISISTAQLLHFSGSDFASARPKLRIASKKSLPRGRRQGSPRHPHPQLFQAELRQKWAEVARMET